MDKMAGKILCIPSQILFINGKWNGLNSKDLDDIKKTLKKFSEFRVRGELENDVTYKQIIPQILLKYDNKYFLHQVNEPTDKRMEKLSPIFLGGHVEKFDSGKSNWDIIKTATNRELEEEVEISSKIIKREFKGLIYIENEFPVNSFHVGFIFEFTLDGDKVKSKEDGMIDRGFVDKGYLIDHKSELSYWSQVYLEYLK